MSNTKKRLVHYLAYRALTPILLFSLFALMGCFPVGPSVIKKDREKYNSAVQKTNEEQLLLNIVRLRYSGNPFFLSVNSVTSSYSCSTNNSMNLNGNWSSSGESRSLSLSSSASKSFSPVITYQPLQGSTYVKRLLSPVSLNGIYQVLRSGWSIARIFRTVAQYFNELPNAPSSARPPTKHPPEFKEFVDAIHQLRDLQKIEECIFEFYTKENANFLLIQFPRDMEILREEYPLLEKLGFNYETNSLLITDSDAIEVSQKYNAVPIQTRTTLGIMYYFSKGVAIPEEHYQQGLIDIAKNQDGTRFDWTNDVLRGMLHIRTSKRYPENAYVIICYNNYWYYLTEDDSDSKESFSLLLQLVAFQEEGGYQSRDPTPITYELR